MNNNPKVNRIPKVIEKLKKKQEILEENLEVIDILGPDQGFNSDNELWKIANERGLLQTENYYRETELIESYIDGICFAIGLLEEEDGK